MFICFYTHNALFCPTKGPMPNIVEFSVTEGKDK